jgi:hypothetical protein
MAIFITWLLPIIVAAIIGYITNDVAIKMLFKPLAEKRIGKWRVPFTPGILPKNRHRLALSLGSIVSRELLNVDVLTRRFHDADFQESIKKATRSFVDYVADSPVGGLKSLTGEESEKGPDVFGNVLRGILESDGLKACFGPLSQLCAQGLGGLEFIPTAGKSDEERSERLLAWLLDERQVQLARRRIAFALVRLKRRDRPLAEILPLYRHGHLPPAPAGRG